MNLEDKITEIENRMRSEAHVMGVWDNHYAFHNKCCDFITLEGLWMEFGVFKGRSICQFAERTKNTIYGFDSFEGLPEVWDSMNPKGLFDLGGVIPEGAIEGISNNSTETKPWPSNVSLIKGWFEDTLPEFLRTHTENCSLIHIDSDLYSSAKTIFAHLEDRIVEGTVIVFDEINDYPDYRLHEIKAFAEFLLKTGKSYKPVVHQNLGYSQGCFIIGN